MNLVSGSTVCRNTNFMISAVGRAEVEPTGRRMVGKWVGFGKEMDVNTGPWKLVFKDASTNKATLDRYNRPPE